jgi:hypothetical protein
MTHSWYPDAAARQHGCRRQGKPIGIACQISPLAGYIKGRSAAMRGMHVATIVLALE